MIILGIIVVGVIHLRGGLIWLARFIRVERSVRR